MMKDGFSALASRETKQTNWTQRRKAGVQSENKGIHLKRAETNADEETSEDGWSGGSQQALFFL